MSNRSIVWVKDAGAELAEVGLAADHLSANGSAIGGDPMPYRLEYVLTTTVGWVTSSLRVRAWGTGWARSLELHRDGSGDWHIDCDSSGSVDLPPCGGDASALTGALDCDLGLSPLTNTMPVLRHAMLDGGEPVEFLMAWVSVPDLRVIPNQQLYTPLPHDGEHPRINYSSGDFTSDLTFDKDGVVLDYPQIARAVPVETS